VKMSIARNHNKKIKKLHKQAVDIAAERVHNKDCPPIKEAVKILKKLEKKDSDFPGSLKSIPSSIMTFLKEEAERVRSAT
jgi:hypothetical protein